MARKLVLKRDAEMRVCIDGVALQTTVGQLRSGAISECLHKAFQDFEGDWLGRNGELTGRGATYWDSHLNRSVMIQLDLY